MQTVLQSVNRHSILEKNKKSKKEVFREMITSENLQLISQRLSGSDPDGEIENSGKTFFLNPNP